MALQLAMTITALDQVLDKLQVETGVALTAERKRLAALNDASFSQFQALTGRVRDDAL